VNHGRRKKNSVPAVIAVVEGERLEPAARATDPTRRTMQEALLDCERLRAEYRAAVDVWKQAVAEVDAGERPQRFADLKLEASQVIVREINRIQNDYPPKLRQTCADAGLNLAQHRATTARNRSAERLQQATSNLDAEKLRWSRHLKGLVQLGTEGEQYRRTDEESGGLRLFGVELLGSAVADATLKVLCREWNAVTSDLRECAALVLLEHDDAAAEHAEAMQEFENARHNRTWSEK